MSENSRDLVGTEVKKPSGIVEPPTTKKSFFEKAAIVALVIIAIPVLISTSIYSYLFNKMQNDANKITDYFFWMGDYWQITVLILILAALATRHLMSMPFSKNSFRKVLVFLISTLSLTMLIDYQNQQRTLFGKYLYNDGPAEKVVYIDKSPTGIYKRNPGKKIDASNIGVAFLVEKSIFPKSVDMGNLTSESLSNGKFVLFENGNPKYYQGTTIKPDGMPRLYDVAGYDPITGEFLVPFDKLAIDKMMLALKKNEGAVLQKRKEQEEARAKKEGEEKLRAIEEKRLQDIRELEEKKKQAVQDAKEKADADRAAAAENKRQIALLKEEAANKAQDERREREKERKVAARSEEIRNSRKRIDLTYSRNEFTIPAGYEVVERNSNVDITINGEVIRSVGPDVYARYDGRVVARTNYCLLCKGDGHIVIQLRN